MWCYHGVVECCSSISAFSFLSHVWISCEWSGFHVSLCSLGCVIVGTAIKHCVTMKKESVIAYQGLSNCSVYVAAKSWPLKNHRYEMLQKQDSYRANMSNLHIQYTAITKTNQSISTIRDTFHPRHNGVSYHNSRLLNNQFISWPKF